MKNNLENNIDGLQCKNPNCDFINTTVELGEYDKWVNEKCPKCGEVLLTEKEFRGVDFLLKVVNWANKNYSNVNNSEIEVGE